MNYITLKNKTTGETVAFTDRNEAATALNVSPTAITKVRTGKNPSVAGWELVGEARSMRDRAITVVNVNDDRKLNFPSFAAAARYFGVAPNATLKWANGTVSRAGWTVEK